MENVFFVNSVTFNKGKNTQCMFSSHTHTHTYYVLKKKNLKIEKQKEDYTVKKNIFFVFSSIYKKEKKIVSLKEEMLKKKGGSCN